MNDMMKPDDIESRAAARAGRGAARRQLTGRTKGALEVVRSRLLRVAMPARDLLATFGPLGAALWALYPVAIVLLIIGFLFAGDGST